MPAAPITPRELARKAATITAGFRGGVRSRWAGEGVVPVSVEVVVWRSA
ncbi:MAG TPA: hypothetical protein VHJ18_22865 [Streptosporangiaceae bacterium]|jgi:hypothetical protein|nr:hypothetical protein [Streptosporangiaceae bacterium]